MAYKEWRLSPTGIAYLPEPGGVVRWGSWSSAEPGSPMQRPQFSHDQENDRWMMVFNNGYQVVVQRWGILGGVRVWDTTGKPVPLDGYQHDLHPNQALDVMVWAATRDRVE